MSSPRNENLRSMAKGLANVKTQADYLRDHQIGLLTILIEMNFDRAKIIIERIAASKRMRNEGATNA